MMYDYKNKQKNLEQFLKLMFDKTLSMFEYTNLPDTIPAIELEKILLTNGYGIFTTKYQNTPYVFTGSLSGEEKDVYQRPTQALIATPMYTNNNLKINTDCVIIKNDDMELGFKYLFEKYGTLMNEIDVTMFMINFNKRIQTLISASDDNTIESANLYLDNIIKGELGVIASDEFLEDLKTNSINVQSSNTTDLVELQQYLKASLYNEIGLNSNYNMKRERLTAGEVDMNTDNLRPLIDNMLKNRQQALEKINDLFGFNISVDFSSIWKIKKDEISDDEVSDDEVSDDEESKKVD